MLQRAYSTFEIKSVDEEKRILRGIASTPATDRMSDIVEPMGAEYKLPIPFLWQHEGREAAIGHVVSASPTKSGIPVEVHIESDDVPGPLKERLDYAWRSIKKKLVRGLSIGFREIESEPIKGTYGLRFTRWEWMELSAVTIPANAEATITSIKSYDLPRQAASGQESGEVRRTLPPGASGKSVSFANTPKPERHKMKRSIPEMVATLEATIEVKRNAQMDVASKAAAEGRTKDAAEQETFDTLHEEIQSLEKELGDWQKMERQVTVARSVDTRPTTDSAVATRSPSVRMEQKAEPGIRFARVVKSLWHAHQSHRDVEVVARSLYPDDHLVHKAAVQAASTTGATWGSQLVGDEGSVFADFVAYLRPTTVLGKFGTNGIPSLRNVPFRTPLISQTGGGEGYWVGEGQAKPLTKFAFTRTTLEPLKVANIAVATKEQLRSSSPSADGIIRDSLADALRARLDVDFIDPAKDVGTYSPASITFGAPTYVSSGDDADDIRLDVRSLFQGFINANNPPTSGVWIMSSSTALSLSIMVNALGQSEFNGIGMNGGTFFGMPVITSEYVGNIVVLVNANDIYLGDEGGISVDVSDQASVEMKDDSGAGAGAVSNNVITPTATSLVSLWQTNSVGFLAEREINWARRRASAVQVLSGVTWGGEVTEEES